MQSFVILWRSFLVYRAGAGAGTGASGAEAFGGPKSLGAGVPSSGLAGCSGLLGLTVLGGTFCRKREPCAMSAEWGLLLSN